MESYFGGCSTIYTFSCVQISDEAILLFSSFVLYSAQVLANSNYVIGQAIYTIQLLYSSLLVNICGPG